MSPLTSAEFDGTLDIAKLWTPTEKNKIIRASHATNRLRVGGTGSSKSSDSLMEALTEYMMRWDGIAVLFIRRQLKDLRKSSILDWKSFVPKGLYDWDETNLVATLYNGSKLFFGHLPNNSEKDLEQYLSAAFPVIVMDECGQFSAYAWQFMSSRNRVNRECQPDEQGNFPVPVMMGNTNPIGAHWGFYKAQFVDKKMFDPPEDAKRDRQGRWWTPDGEGGWKLEYDPADWDFVHSTLYDNPALMARDPDLLRKLNALPKALRDKLLSGHLDSTVGQFFDVWDEKLNVIDLGTDPDAIIWQPWQPRWMSWDWGRAHWNAVYWFTVAMVRKADRSGYVHKTVCYREYVDRGKKYEDLAHNVATMTKLGLPGHPEATKIQIIFFSHEKFSISKEKKETQSPAAILSGHLLQHGLPALTRNDASPGTRIGKASLMYDKIETCSLVVLAWCRHIIEAIPQLVRDEENREDVLKIDGKPDDCYDGFSMGLFNWYKVNKKPRDVQVAEEIEAAPDERSKHWIRLRETERRNRMHKGKNWWE